ncbi:MAG: hypothetical protein AABZ55_15065 [Bdellovibrionota bacterium]
MKMILNLFFLLPAFAWAEYEPPFDSGTPFPYQCEVSDLSDHRGLIHLNFILHQGRARTWTEGKVAFYIFGSIEFLDLTGSIRGENFSPWITKSFANKNELLETIDTGAAFLRAVKYLGSSEGTLLDGVTTLRLNGNLRDLQIKIRSGVYTYSVSGPCHLLSH